MRYILALAVIVSCSVASAQGVTKRTLFLDNSYTGVNNLPHMVANIATSMGDTFIYDSNTPGGSPTSTMVVHTSVHSVTNNM